MTNALLLKRRALWLAAQISRNKHLHCRTFTLLVGEVLGWNLARHGCIWGGEPEGAEKESEQKADPPYLSEDRLLWDTHPNLQDVRKHGITRGWLCCCKVGKLVFPVSFAKRYHVDCEKSSALDISSEGSKAGFRLLDQKAALEMRKTFNSL